MIVGVLLGLLIEAGTEVRDKLTQSNGDWNALFASSDFQSMEGKLDSVLAQLRGDAIHEAVAALQAKKNAILNGRDPTALTDPIAHKQFFAILKVENTLCLKELAEANSSKGIAQVLVNTILPAIEHVAPVVLAIFV